MKNNSIFLFFLSLLTACNSYQGPFFYMVKDENPQYILWETVSEMSQTVDELSNLIFVIDTSICSHCKNLETVLIEFLKKKDFSIYHINFDLSITAEEDYDVLLSITNGGKEAFLPAYEENFFVPIMFVVENKVAVYSIENDFTKTLDNCIKIR